MFYEYQVKNLRIALFDLKERLQIDEASIRRKLAPDETQAELLSEIDRKLSAIDDLLVTVNRSPATTQQQCTVCSRPAKSYFRSMEVEDHGEFIDSILLCDVHAKKHPGIDEKQETEHSLEEKLPWE